MRVERVLATARFLLALLAVWWLLQGSGSRAGAYLWTVLLALAYATHAAAVLGLLFSGPSVTRALRVTTHGMDVAWVGCIALVTPDFFSPLSVFLVFVLLAASYRWRFREAILTAAAVVVVLTLGAVVLERWPGLRTFLGVDFNIRRYLSGGAYLVMASLTLGFLAEGEKKLRAEAAIVARIMTNLQAATGLSGSLQAWMHEILRYFKAHHALLALREIGTDRLYLWEGTMGRGGRPTALRLTELDASVGDTYLFPLPGQGLVATLPWGQKDGTTFRATALDASGTKMGSRTVELPARFLEAHPSKSLIALSASFGEEWSCRLFILDPRLYVPAESAVRFLQNLIHQTGPALYTTYLVRRLRVRAGTLERARVARELHDGVIQSLISVEMQVDVLRRRAEGPSLAPPPLVTELSRIQGLLRGQVRELRDLMDEMKQSGPGPGDFLQFLTNLVDKYERDTGISVKFISELREVLLPPRVCREIARIVQEALVNIRKHSQAQHVVIRLCSSGASWMLVVDDDGRGFGFSGRMTHAQLDALRKGPVTIKERVRAIQGELTIDSVPGHGVRLEVSIPHAAHAHYV